MLSYMAAKQIYNDIADKWDKNTDERKIIHYTSTEVLNLILSTATFRASHVLYLNDAEEYYKGIELITSAINNENNFSEFKNSEGIFSISFSEGEDLLSQWITYAKESGVAIELDNELMLIEAKENKPYFSFGIEDYTPEKKDYDDEQFNYHRIAFYTSNVLQRIRYVTSNEEDIKTQLSESYHKTCETDINGMPLYATYIKTGSFEAEKEIRAAFIYQECIKNAKRYYPKIKYFRMKTGALRPYINVKIQYCKGTKRYDKVTYEPKLPLKSITIGPSGNQQTVFDSVVHRIKYGEKKVYDYSDDKERFEKNFDSYLTDVLEFIKKNFKRDYVEKKELIKKELIHQWKKRNPSKETLIEDICAFKTDNISTCNSLQLSNNYNKTEKNDMQHIVSEIDKNFYFSKEGILIKKSKIPYIF